jgi:hypothetical protein
MLMKSRRRIAFPQGPNCATWFYNYSRISLLAEWVSGVSLHSSNPEPPMPALGQKRTSQDVRVMSAYPQKQTSLTAIANIR